MYILIIIELFKWFQFGFAIKVTFFISVLAYRKTKFNEYLAIILMTQSNLYE